MSTLSVSHPRTARPALVALAIMVAGAALMLSPYIWMRSWRDTGFSTAYVPFHLWGWLPFVALAVAVSRLPRRLSSALGAAIVAGSFASLVLTQSLDPDTRTIGILIPGALTAAVVCGWGFSEHRRRPAPRDTSAGLITGVFAALLAVIVCGRLLQVGELARVQNFLVIGTSIAVEALPFVLLGAAVSALIEVFVPERWFAAIARLPLGLQVPSVALAGLAMPVCECGSVPVARRLILRGVHPAAGIAFMLSAPVINPVVLFSTAVAYHGRGAFAMVVGRAALGLLVAIVAGLLIARSGAGKLVDDARTRANHHHGHDHGHGGRPRAFVDHLAADLLLMGKFIVLGAALAAAMQTVIPQSVFTGLLTSPLVGALIMIVLAFFLSLCSEADAFVAVSFIQFPLGPQLAFLAAGPVLDTKLVLLYGGTFGRTFVLKLALVVIPVVVGGSMVFQLIAG